MRDFRLFLAARVAATRSTPDTSPRGDTNRVADSHAHPSAMNWRSRGQHFGGKGAGCAFMAMATVLQSAVAMPAEKGLMAGIASAQGPGIGRKASRRREPNQSAAMPCRRVGGNGLDLASTLSNSRARPLASDAGPAC